MLRKSNEAFKLLLDGGADLLLYETFETVDYVADGLNPKPIVRYTDIAIIYISLRIL
jgi:methionine synthase I (cobalamin-dependent)